MEGKCFLIWALLYGTIQWVSTLQDPPTIENPSDGEQVSINGLFFLISTDKDAPEKNIDDLCQYHFGSNYEKFSPLTNTDAEIMVKVIGMTVSSTPFWMPSMIRNGVRWWIEEPISEHYWDLFPQSGEEDKCIASWPLIPGALREQGCKNGYNFVCKQSGFGNISLDYPVTAINYQMGDRIILLESYMPSQTVEDGVTSTQTRASDLIITATATLSYTHNPTTPSRPVLTTKPTDQHGDSPSLIPATSLSIGAVSNHDENTPTDLPPTHLMPSSTYSTVYTLPPSTQQGDFGFESLIEIVLHEMDDNGISYSIVDQFETAIDLKSSISPEIKTPSPNESEPEDVPLFSVGDGDNVTKQPTATTEANTNENPTSCCECSSSPIQNMTLEVIQELTKSIQKNLTVETSSLSATIRKKTSAYDSRPSSQLTGIIGVLSLVLTFGSVVVLDLLRVLRYLPVLFGCREGPKT